MQVTLASRRSPNATSNEHFIAATASVAVVVDGASVPPELGTGCRHGTAWFARQLGTQLLALLTTQADRSPADSLAQAITNVAVLHADTCDLSHPGSPSATVAILREQPEAVDWLVLGDTTVLLEERTGIRVVTDDRLEHVAAGQHRVMHHHATGSADHDRSFAELVTEQRRHRNHPDGFWVASIDPSAAEHALTDTVARDGCSERPCSATARPGWWTASACSSGRASYTSWPSRDQTRSSSRSERPRPVTRTATVAARQATRRRLRRLLPPDLTPELCAWDELQLEALSMPGRTS